MISAFIDSDIIIDLLTHREPHFYESAKVIQKCQDGKISLYTSPLAIANVHYMVRKSKGEQQTREVLKKLLTLIKITVLDSNCVLEALNSKMKDFEDAMQTESADPYDCNYIITRNIKDYKVASIDAKTPFEINSILD
jgi:predicted nucleic acid-binding protein